MSNANDPRPTITGLIGVYNADGTLRGELAYVVGSRLGTAHCSLCDITHGRMRERPQWRDCRDGLPVPFETFHRNDQPEVTRMLAADKLPVVVATTTAGAVLLLGPDELERCGSSPERLVEAIGTAAERHHLEWS